MLRLLENGPHDVRPVDDLDPDVLSQWIRDRLHGVDTAAPDDPRRDIGQYYLVGAIYPSLQLSTQADVRRTLLRFLREMLARPEDWAGAPGDDLLSLVMKVGERDLAVPIRRMAERGQFLDGEVPDEDRHARLVQALADLGEKMPSDFWKEQVRRAPDRYLTLAFAGLRNTSVYQALDLLGTVVPFDDAARFRLRPSVRGLLRLDWITRDQLRKMVDLIKTLPPDARAFVREALPELWAGLTEADEPAETLGSTGQQITNLSQIQRWALDREGGLKPATLEHALTKHALAA